MTPLGFSRPHSRYIFLFCGPRYNTEKAFRATLEADLEGLRKVMDNLTIVRTDLEMEIEGMRKQLIYMRKSHEEVSSHSMFFLYRYVIIAKVWTL